MKIITDKELKNFERIVQQHLDAGYEVVGNLTVTSAGCACTMRLSQRQIALEAFSQHMQEVIGGTGIPNDAFFHYGLKLSSEQYSSFNFTKDEVMKITNELEDLYQEEAEESE